MKKHTLIIIISLVVMLFAASATATFAWFTKGKSLDIDSSGGILRQYFHKGSGTENDPYEITRPVHYYNLVMLYQVNPEFKENSKFINAATHFRLGSKDLDLDGIDESEVCRVFNYEDNGTSDNKAAADGCLNLKSYCNGVFGTGLFPIGSAQKPFQASFDGSELTLKNLTVVGSVTLGDVTYKTPDIGLFGYVAKEAKIENLYAKDFSIDLSSVDGTDSQQVEEGLDTTHTGHVGKAYVGYIAGHIITNAQINNVYINDCLIAGGNAVECKFGFFGRVEDENGNEVTTLGTEIATQRKAGDAAGFGGSLDMKKIHERLQKIWREPNAKVPSSYDKFEYVIVDQDGVTVKITSDTSGNITYQDNSFKYRRFVSNSGFSGEYYFYQYYTSSLPGHQFMCLYGVDPKNPKTVFTYTLSADDQTARYISSGENYLDISANGDISASSDKDKSAKWVFDQDGHDQGHIFAYYDKTSKYDSYYLNASGLSKVTCSTSPQTVWKKDNATGELFTTIDGYNYYLYYDDYYGEWRISSVKRYYYITDGAGNYLSATEGNTPAIKNETSYENSVKWQAEIKIENGSYTFHTVINDKVYYITCNRYGQLTLGTSKFSWTKKGDYFTATVEDVVYKLVYDGGWKVVTEGKLITDGNNHYLSATAAGTVRNSTASDSVIWQITEEGDNVTIFTVLNGNKYYLSLDSSNKLTISQTPYNLKKEGNTYYAVSGDTNYYIQYAEGNWRALPVGYQIIKSGNNYLKADGEANGGISFSNVTDESQATRFYFSNENQGTAFYYHDGNRYEFGQNNGSFFNSATVWVKDGNKLKANGTDYYLTYDNADNSWKILDCGYYTISFGNNYLNINSSGNGVTNGTSDNATLWKFSNTSNETNPSGTIREKKTGQYLYINRSGSWLWGYNYTLTVSLTRQEWTNSNGKLLNNSRNRYVTYSSGWTTTDSQSDATTLTFTKVTASEIEVKKITPVNVEFPELTVENAPVPAANVQISPQPYEVNYPLNHEETTEKVVIKEKSEPQPGGYHTYFPLKIAEEKTVDKNGNVIDSYDKIKGWYDENEPYKASLQNTGYIVSGARITGTNAVTAQKRAGDIRISYFPIDSIKDSYNSNNNAFTTIYTVDANGRRTVTDTSDVSVYGKAKSQLLKTLKGSSSVYGLHFMDAEIGEDHLVTAKKAVLLGKVYDNYQMPLDSINFHLIERGAISFFAGTYFQNNNTFFSLHQVFRNDKNVITEIKEIAEIYEHQSGTTQPYCYKFTDGTYSDGTTQLPQGYNSTPIFKTEWITNPGISEGSEIYYYEIPVNKGEYCLGSVKGKTGAYLIYLDIAANGGDAISSIISSEGNAVTNAFKAEYRYSPETLGDNNYSVLLFSISAPAGANKDNFSVKVRFIPPGAGTENDYSKGMYEITVINKSNVPLQLDVFLCDDDRDPTNDFLYAYKVIYTNETKTSQIIKTPQNRDYWKSMASFTIPSQGEATEVDYHQ